MNRAKQILKEAGKIITGPRRESYGSPLECHQTIAALWKLLFGWDVTPRQVCLAMICVKLAREKGKGDRDNLLDIIGYSALAEEVSAGKDSV